MGANVIHPYDVIKSIRWRVALIGWLYIISVTFTTGGYTIIVGAIKFFLYPEGKVGKLQAWMQYQISKHNNLLLGLVQSLLVLYPQLALGVLLSRFLRD